MLSGFTNLICSAILEKMAMFVFVWERWLGSCLSPNAEFTNKILPNSSFCEPNCLQKCLGTEVLFMIPLLRGYWFSWGRILRLKRRTSLLPCRCGAAELAVATAVVVETRSHYTTKAGFEPTV